MKYADRQGLFKRLFGSKRKSIIPSNARFLLADLFGSPDKVFTEEDLTSKELDYLKTNLVEIINSGRFVDKETVAIQPGGEYTRSPDDIMFEGNLLSLIKKSFDPALSLKTSLGKSTLDLSGGQAVIKDMYDFELEPNKYKNATLLEVLTESGQLNAYDLVSALAGKFGSDAREGEGKPVSINLGSLEDLGIGPFPDNDIQMGLFNIMRRELMDEMRSDFMKRKSFKKKPRRRRSPSLENIEDILSLSQF